MSERERYRDEHGRKIPFDIHRDFGFESSPGSSVSDFAMALCGMARSMFWPIQGSFNGHVLTAWENSEPTGLVCDYLAIAAHHRRQMEKQREGGSP